MLQTERQPQSPRRPLIGLALVYIAGTWGAVAIGGLPPAWPGAAAVGLLILALIGHGGAYLARRRRAVASVFDPVFPVVPRLISGAATLALYLAVGAMAWYAAGLRLYDPSPNALCRLMDNPRESVEVEGIVGDDPAVRPAEDVERELWSFPLRLESIRRVIPWQKARGTVQVVLPVPTGGHRPCYGERWRLAGVLTDNARYPEDEFAANSSRPVLDWLNRRYTFRADPDAAVCLVPYQGSPLMDACFKLRRKCGDTLALGIDHRPDVVGLLQALLLGYRQELPEKLRNDFIVTGTYHIFAISGQHVAILALFIIVVLQSYRISRVKWFLYVTPILLGFTLSTGLTPSAVRGCLMALLCFLGPWVGRKPDIPSAMALAALIILAINPLQLFDYGFLLSFIAVIGLIVLCPPMLQRLAPAVAPDTLRLQPEPKPVHWTRIAVRTVVFLFVTSLAACLVTTPLVARWFNLVSPVALLANLIVIPLTTLVLLAGCLAIVFGSAVPVLGAIFNFANVALVSVLLWVIDLMARIPYGHFFVRSLPLWSLAIWYGTLAAWVVWHRRTWLWVAGPVLLGLALGAGWVGSGSALTVDLLYPGDRPACFVNGPGGDDLLIDPGSRYQVRKVIRHLRRQGVDRLEAVVLSGADSSRAGGTPELLQAMPVNELWFPSGYEKSRALRETLEIARVRGVILRQWPDNDRVADDESGNQADSVPRRFTEVAGPRTGKPPQGATRLYLFRGETRDGSWFLRQGAISVLYLDAGTNRAAAAPGAQLPDLKPDVIVKNRMGIGPEQAGDAGAEPEVGCAWRIICSRSLQSGGGEDLAHGNKILQLAPGQGMRIRVDRDQIRLERLSW